MSALASASCGSTPSDSADHGPGTTDPATDDGDGIDGDSSDADPAPKEEPLVAEAGEADETTFDDDLVAIPEGAGLGQAELANGTPQVVYVNFGGPIVRTCSGFCNDALTNHSTLIASNFKRTALDFLPYTSLAGRSLIVSRLRTYYAPYNVIIATSRPAHGPYTMVVISPSAVGPTGKRGVSYLDCGNSMTRSDLGFVFRIGGVSAGTIARYAAHELGHMLGLMHVRSTSDIMEYASSGHLFTSSTLDVARNPPNYTCFPGHTVQNAPATLKLDVGLRQ